MVKLTPGEPQYAADYDDRATRSVRAALVEIGQILGSYRGRFVVIGGAVPWLLLDNPEMPHVGTLDIDLGLDAEALGDGDYATLIEALMRHGYQQDEGLRRFQLVRSVPADDGGPPVRVILDFLMPKHAEIERHRPPMVADFAVQRADGADLAIQFQQIVTVDGPMPTGGGNSVKIAVCSIPALLAMKGHALAGRYKQKDAYDIFYCIRNYPGGVVALAEACRPLLLHSSGAQGYRCIDEKFASVDAYGPTCVRKFIEDSRIAGDITADQWQQDAFGQVDAWLRTLGLRA